MPKRRRDEESVPSEEEEDEEVEEGEEEEEEEEAEAGAGGGSETARTIYVEGIPYSCNEGDLEEFFKSSGTIQEIRMPRFQDSGKVMGYAHVVFSHKKAVNKAVRRDGEYLGSRFLSIEPAMARKQPEGADREQPPGCVTIFVKNIPYDTDEDAVSMAFRRFGKVENVRLARWQHTQRLKGFGYVQFSKPPEARAAVEAADVKLSGRPLFVDYETGAPKKSFKTPTGRSWHKEHKDSAARGGGRAGAGRGRGRGRGRGEGERPAKRGRR